MIIKNRAISVLRLCVSLLALSIMHNAFADHPATLPNSKQSPNFGYEVNWVGTNPYNPDVDGDGSCDVTWEDEVPAGADGDWFPQAGIDSILDAYDSDGAFAVGAPNGHHAGFVALGFTPDSWRKPTEVYNCIIHGDGCDHGIANPGLVRLPSPAWVCANDADLRLLVGHEHFHHMQYGAGLSSGRWTKALMEGSARMMQDQVYADLDANLGNLCCAFLNQVNAYLNSPNRFLFSDDVSYDAALWWKYASEQFGAFAPEPNLGTDFIARMFTQAASEPGSADLDDLINSTIKQTHPSRSIDSAFHDFTIANAAREFDVSGLDTPLRYQYLDEQDGVSPAFNDVRRIWQGSIGDGTPKSDSLLVSEWGALYTEADITACPDGVAGYKAEGDRAAHGLLVVRKDGTVDRLLKEVTGTFRRAIIVSRSDDGNAIEKFIASTAGPGDPAGVNYTYACGQATLEIVRPNSEYLAHVGNFDTPQRFILRVKIDGPAELGLPTVQGLSPDDFDVYVGAENPLNQATVISGAEVQGEFWLTVQAPVKPANGDYDLLVKLRSIASSSEANAVRYEDMVLDHVAVIDRSGSMLLPDSFPRIDAAKNAASVIADAENGTSKLGVVSFGGDNTEDNDDATVNAQLQLIDGNRDLVKGAIAGISIPNASVLTSIGDGLQKGMDEIQARGTLVGKDVITLLSDGAENEAAFVAALTPALVARGIQVNTIALGPWADQSLLNELANETGGTFSYVDVGTTASPLNRSKGRAAVDIDALPMQLRLVEAYLGAFESSNQLQRLGEKAGNLKSGETLINFNLSESALMNGRVTLAWSTKNSSIDVKAYFQDNQLENGVGGVEIYSTATHFEVQLPELDKGELVLVVTSDSDNIYYAAVSGQPVYGANMWVHLDQPFDEVPNFILGAPVRLVAKLDQTDAPITGAQVYANVIHPTAGLDKIPLFDDGAHYDGEAGDGVYGNIYRRTTVADTTSRQDPPGEDDPGVVASYRVYVTASGETSKTDKVKQEQFLRFWRGSFVVAPRLKSDTDGDGLPDAYEDSLECLSSSRSDATSDPDQDNLTNFQEWERGVNPCEQDTDFGGLIDSWETSNGVNPFDPANDDIPRPRLVEVVDSVSDHLPDDFQLTPGAISLRYPTNNRYFRVRVLRSVNKEGPYSVIDEFAPNGSSIYLDKAVREGVSYYYRVQALGASGQETAISPTTTGIAKLDPYAPVGGLRIRGIESKATHITTSRDVLLLLSTNADEDVEYRVRNIDDAEFTLWKPFRSQLEWTVSPDKTGTAMVLAQYRDASGNVSETYDSVISVVDPGTVGSVAGVISVTGLADTLTGFARITVEGTNLPPVYTNSEGRFFLGILPAGTYTLNIAVGDGTEPVTAQVVVAPGEETRVQFDIVLPTPPEPPTLRDIEPDENMLTLYARPNGDGGSPIESYDGVCKSEAGESEASSLTGVIQVEELVNDVDYTCYVRAVNSEGSSDPSNALVEQPGYRPDGLPVWLLKEAADSADRR